MRLKTSKGKKVTYSLICVFVSAKKRKQNIENRKKRKVPIRYVLKEYRKKRKVPTR